MKSASNIVLKLLGVLLLTGATLKGWQLLTEPMANSDIWTNRAFLIFTVEFEIALGIWLLSGLFKKAAWLSTISCFSLFSFITLYKGLSGAESCGCFGSVQVNPWITLFAIDLPAVIALSLLQPKSKNRLFGPVPSIVRLAGISCFLLVMLGISTAVLAFNKPKKITSSYEILEPETWIGKELPILEHIDIGDKIKKGMWLVVLYHHDCPDCQAAIPQYEPIARDLAGNEDVLQIALIEVPPYDTVPRRNNSPCILGKLNNTKERFVTTPAAALLRNGSVQITWEQETPDFETILQNIAYADKRPARDVSASDTQIRAYTTQKGG